VVVARRVFPHKVKSLATVTTPKAGGPTETATTSVEVMHTPEFSDEIEYLRTTPVEQVLGNHIFVLLQLVAVYLAATPPNFESARLVIDTLAAMLEAAGDRLGEHSPLYRSALAEVQQAYARTVAANADAN